MWDGCWYALFCPVMIGGITYGLYRLVGVGDRWMAGGK